MQDNVHAISEIDDPASLLAKVTKHRYARDLHRAVELARIATSSQDELLTRLEQPWSEAYRPEIYMRLNEMSRTDAEQAEMARWLDELIDAANNSFDPRQREARERVCFSLLHVLSLSASRDVLGRCLHHERRRLRNAAYRSLRRHGVPAELVPVLVAQYHETRRQEALEPLASSPETLGHDDVCFLLDECREQGVCLRTMRSLMEFDPKHACQLADAYPVEFAYAVGRTGNWDALTVLRQMLEHRMDDPEFLYWCVWACGKIHARDELEGLQPTVQAVQDRFKSLLL